MFGMGWQEILLILVIGVLVIGPDQLPQVARGLGKVIAQFRRATNDLRDHVNREFSQDDTLKEFKEFQQSIDNEVRSIGHTAQSYVEKEVAAEEAELTRLEVDMKEAASTAMAATSAATWMPDPDPAPTEATPPVENSAGAVAEQTTAPAPDQADDAPNAPDARKTSA